ncbi:hypothetical protein M413DRAFT_22049 [Hebeloma cylindrosporum]|uniref:F-box domain-containing protein n=1 Tax=Hebeloma cylindrosporum TaxID=76867 RepID=A0A0C3CMM6_HEBCY|nr:hypothetical protein M413DRAFT_22049 [Hebeloma cylindrosporum h7]
MNNPLNQQIIFFPANSRIGSATFPESIHRLIFDFLILGPVVLPSPRLRDDLRRLLTQVCPEWRRIIISTPAYWNSFTFVQRAVQRPHNIFRLAQRFFKRSGNSIPLSISFGRSLQRNVGRNIFEILVRPRLWRVRFLSCSITRETLRILFGRDPVYFPVLEAINIVVVPSVNRSVASQIPLGSSIDFSGFHLAPRLRDVRLHIVDGVHPTKFRLPWHQLTRLDLGRTSIQVHAFMNIMEQSILLEDGSFNIIFTRHRDRYTALRRMSIQRLRFLRLRLVHPSRDVRMFSSLHIPFLEELRVDRVEFGNAIRDMDIYETFFTAVNASLQHVTIAEYSFPHNGCFVPRLNNSPRMIYQRLDGVLGSCPHLTSLFLYRGVFIHPFVLDKLATGELLPLLEQLGVSSVHGWDIIWMVQRKNFISMIPEAGPSSLTAPRVIRPVALEYLRLSIIGPGLTEDDAQKLEDAVMALDLARGYVIRLIDVA